jgi:hypothetical protein
MYFDAKIQVIINNQTTGEAQVLQTVHSVSTKNDSKEIGASCNIVVPLACRIQYVNAPNTFVTDLAKNLFSSGDLVTVTAWYESMPEVTVFKGFVYEFIEGTPMTIKCLDSIFLLNQSTVDLHFKSITLKDLINTILKPTPAITLILPTLDLTLANLTFRLMSPAAILEWIKKEIGLNISLSGDKLYCNIASNTLNVVKLNTSRNVIKSDLQKPEAVYLKLQVKCWFINQNGTKTSFEVGDPGGELREVFFYKIPQDMVLYEKLAGEALTKYKQFKFSGNVETLLYPDVQLFDQVEYVDVRYPDRTGNYVCVAVNWEINNKGYHKKLKLAYLSDLVTPAVNPINN